MMPLAHLSRRHRTTLLLLVLALASACEERAPAGPAEFLPSKALPHLFLVKQVPTHDAGVRAAILEFLRSRPIPDAAALPVLRFYRYTTRSNLTGLGRSGTAYFLEQAPDPGGFSSETLEAYATERLASLSLRPCPHDPSKRSATFYFHGLRGELDEVDTVTFDCNL